MGKREKWGVVSLVAAFIGLVLIYALAALLAIGAQIQAQQPQQQDEQLTRQDVREIVDSVLLEVYD